LLQINCNKKVSAQDKNKNLAAQGWAAFPRKSRDAISAGLLLGTRFKALFSLVLSFFCFGKKESTFKNIKT